MECIPDTSRFKIQRVTFLFITGCSAMVARLLWEQDAVGSSPVTPTTEKGHEAPSPSVTFFLIQTSVMIHS